MEVLSDVKFSIWLQKDDLSTLMYIVETFTKNNLTHPSLFSLQSCSHELGVARARESASPLHFKSLSFALGKADSVPVKFSNEELLTMVNTLDLPIFLREKLTLR